MRIITRKYHLLRLFGIDGQRMFEVYPKGPWVYLITECWVCGHRQSCLAPAVALRHGLECEVCGFMAEYPTGDR